MSEDKPKRDRSSPALPTVSPSQTEAAGHSLPDSSRVSSDLHVILVAPEIPWNTGNVGRTCLATGAQLHLVRPFGFRLDAHRLRRAGLDYWQHVQPVIWPSWQAVEAQLGDLGLVHCFSAEARQELWEVDFAPPSVLVFGSEGQGLPRELRARYDERLVRLPMVSGPVRSLNLSTAVAVSLYEVKRQRKVKRQRVIPSQNLA